MFFLRLIRCLFLWNVRPATDALIQQSHAIFAFSDSKMKDGTPGEGNRAIAKTATMLRERFHLPILAQEEVALATGSCLAFEFVARGDKHGVSTFRWNTATITQMFAKVCQQKDWSHIVIVATPAHQRRAIWVAERYGFHAVAAPMPKVKYFHKDLALWACRGGEWRFRMREFAVRIFFLLRGDI